MEARLLAPDLYQYLLSLASALEAANEREVARSVSDVSRHIAGSTSELYGEARLLLPRVLRKYGNKLTEQECDRLRGIIAGIEHEFDLIGGG